MEPIIVIHGGAGGYRFSNDEERLKYVKELEDATINGLKALQNGGAVDAVEAAVSNMEDSGLFDAGKGSVLTISGNVEVDAGIMDGRSMRIGAVAAVKNVANPIKLARMIMEKTSHVIIAGDGAAELAKLWKLYTPTHKLYSDAKSRRYEDMLRDYKSGKGYFSGNLKLISELGIGDTVGAVALDKDGNLAAGTSTGGVWLKLDGRVGDSPIPGAGYWAQNGVAAFSASGLGEVIVRSMVCIRAAYLVENGLSIGEALRRVVDDVTKRYGNGLVGVIGIDAKGNVASSFNTSAMARAWGRGSRVMRIAFYPDDAWP
ncbi:isoaspartyl peptidase/L-asparaginase [Caldivirga maquilingensis]|uniref:Plant-type L-asparaginase n=1 Tax=Caldivirga maquilingensis (strain ATCC 700844 / DSM 13496 / JCM 10307 / IC-167) TaxID=397948 RepID=A8MAW8_CALMQ|nr:isoaspartyl peptidase/L-asparaginase [Caldivirga maquilingensis]ABW02597.1 peptidase T2 asparaginase 2 [Caldivirga maquilingensis IC-167]